MKNDGEIFVRIFIFFRSRADRKRAARTVVANKQTVLVSPPPPHFLRRDVTEELSNSAVLCAHSAAGGNSGFSVAEDAANITPIRADATNELVL